MGNLFQKTVQEFPLFFLLQIFGLKTKEVSAKSYPRATLNKVWVSYR